MSLKFVLSLDLESLFLSWVVFLAVFFVGYVPEGFLAADPVAEDFLEAGLLAADFLEAEILATDFLEAGLLAADFLSFSFEIALVLLALDALLAGSLLPLFCFFSC